MSNLDAKRRSLCLRSSQPGATAGPGVQPPGVAAFLGVGCVAGVDQVRGLPQRADSGTRFSFSSRPRAGVGVRVKGGDRGERLLSNFSSSALSDLGNGLELLLFEDLGNWALRKKSK